MMKENNTQYPDPHMVETFRRTGRRTFILLGHGGHGKGSVAKILRDEYAIPFLSSSAAAWSIIWPAFSEATGYKYDDAEQAYANRAEHRQLLKALISLLNTPDKTALTRYILRKADGYDGMRCAAEYSATRNLFTHKLWVDASDRVKPDKSMGVRYENDMIVIDNNGNESELPAKVAEAMGRLVL